MNHTVAGKNPRPRASSTTVQSIKAFSDRLIEKVIIRQQQESRFCYERSQGDIDRFTDCFERHFDVFTKDLPKMEAGIEWAGVQFNRCLGKKNSLESDCQTEYRHNVEFFVPGLD